MLAAIDDNTRVVFIANPNNPTGTWFGPDALETFLAKVPSRCWWCWTKPISNTPKATSCRTV